MAILDRMLLNRVNFVQLREKSQIQIQMKTKGVSDLEVIIINSVKSHQSFPYISYIDIVVNTCMFSNLSSYCNVTINFTCTYIINNNISCIFNQTSYL